MRDGLCRRSKSMPGVLVVEIALLLPGQERWKTVVGGVQYDYCTERGEFFSWVSIILDGSMTEEQVFQLIAESYTLTQPKRAAKAQSE